MFLPSLLLPEHCSASRYVTAGVYILRALPRTLLSCSHDNVSSLWSTGSIALGMRWLLVTWFLTHVGFHSYSTGDFSSKGLVKRNLFTEQIMYNVFVFFRGWVLQFSVSSWCELLSIMTCVKVYYSKYLMNIVFYWSAFPPLDKILTTHNWRKERFIWLTVAEGSVHAPLAIRQKLMRKVHSKDKPLPLCGWKAERGRRTPEKKRQGTR